MNLIGTETEAAPHSVHVVPFKSGESEAGMKVENQSQIDGRGLGENVVKCELVEFHNNINNSDAFNLNHNNMKAVVMFEKIPKNEKKILSDVPTTKTCADKLVCYRDAFSVDDLNSDPDPDPNPDLERDPFGDIDCDPSFSRNSQSNNARDDCANQGNYSLNPTSSAKNISPSVVSTASTSNNLRQPKTLASFLQCQLCLEAQGTKQELETHVKICAETHEDRHRFCVLCNKLYVRPLNYRLHARQIHGIMKECDRRIFKCSLCPTSFAYKETLMAHSALHGERNTFRNTTADLNWKPFKCPEKSCKKTFRKYSHLQYHLRSAHSKERPFKCQESNCDKTFILNGQLQKHMTCHSEKRPFQCSYSECNKMFKNKEGLVQHLRVHTGGRLARCKIK